MTWARSRFVSVPSVQALSRNLAMLKTHPNICRESRAVQHTSSSLPVRLAAFVVKDDDLGFEDDVLGAYEIELDDAEFIMRPREAIPMTLQLLEADDSGFINDMKAMSRAVRLCCCRISSLQMNACDALLWEGPSEDLSHWAMPTELQSGRCCSMACVLTILAVHPAGAQADEEAEAACARREEEEGRQEGPQSGGLR